MSKIMDELSALESFLDQSITDLDNDIAEESLLSKPKTADQMIEKATKTIAKKCKTVEDCDDFLAKMKAEEEKYNKALTDMKEAAKAFKDGEIDKKVLRERIKPASKELKKTCDIISFKDVNDSTDNVTDEEIEKVRDFIVGATSAIKERKDELCSDDAGCESFLGSLITDGEIATEASADTVFVISYLAAIIACTAIALKCGVNGKDNKYIKQLHKEYKPKIKELKKSIKIAKRKGDYNKAIAQIKELIKLYQQCQKAIEGLAKDVKFEYSKNTNGEEIDKYYKSYSVASADAKKRYEDEIQKLNVDIKLIEQKARKSSTAVESCLRDAYTDAMLEEDDNDDDEDTLASLESFLMTNDDNDDDSFAALESLLADIED